MDDSAGVDIVGRAIAILEEEVRSWAQQRGPVRPPEQVPPSDERDEGGDGR